MNRIQIPWGVIYNYCNGSLDKYQFLASIYLMNVGMRMQDKKHEPTMLTSTHNIIYNIEGNRGKVSSKLEVWLKTESPYSTEEGGYVRVSKDEVSRYCKTPLIKDNLTRLTKKQHTQFFRETGKRFVPNNFFEIVKEHKLGKANLRVLMFLLKVDGDKDNILNIKQIREFTGIELRYIRKAINKLEVMKLIKINKDKFSITDSLN